MTLTFVASSSGIGVSYVIFIASMLFAANDLIESST